MDTLQDIFRGTSIQVLRRLYELEENPVIEDSITSSSFKNYPYLKQINVVYSNVSCKVGVGFSNKMLHVLQEHTEESIQKLYNVIDINNLFSNVIGIILYKIYSEIKPIYYDFKYELPYDISWKEMKKYENLHTFNQGNDIIMYFGFSIKE